MPPHEPSVTAQPRRVAVLGSTGSIGCSALEVIAASGGRLTAAVLAAHRRTALIEEQARRFKPRWVVVTDAQAARRHAWNGLPRETELCVGPEAVAEVVAAEGVDIVLSGIVGSAGLAGTWAALHAGKTIALANKESLVVAGSLIAPLARELGVAIIPVDSEHSAVFQALQTGRREEVRRVILTASGGPFRAFSAAQLAHVTVPEALAHPTWEMGPKITVDSATMMNKALEIVEARWLFDLDAEQIGVVIHPQSIVHSLVEFVDGSIIAQLSPPDMRLPIQYALTWPERRESVAEKLQLTDAVRLDFEPADFDRFPALALGMEVARRGGTAGAVLNGANEAAVAAFLGGRLAFDRIAPACRGVLESHHFEPAPTLERLIELDCWSRQEVSRWISC